MLVFKSANRLLFEQNLISNNRKDCYLSTVRYVYLPDDVLFVKKNVKNFRKEVKLG